MRTEQVPETRAPDGPQRAADERSPAPLGQAVLLAVWIVAITAAGAVLRLADLGNRPMHCDEAVHGIKFGRLLEEDDYVYDPREYHGPSLNFLTLPIAWAASAEKLTEVTEKHLRLLPAIFGIALVAMVWLVRDELGRAAVACAAVLTAVSPAMVFFSRYYIQEMLLVCFTFGAMVAVWRYGRIAAISTSGDLQAPCCLPPRRAAWLVLLGLCIGMMHASKETCAIALAAMAPAALTLRPLRKLGIGRILLAGLLVVLVAAGVSMLFFSSFLRNPQGIVDSLTTYFVYLGRSSGEGSVGRHVYPWDYYLRVLFWWHDDGGRVWTEASIAALALLGLVAAVLGRAIRPASLPFVRFLAIYTVAMTLVYSVLPYKTPWCALGFLHGMILLAGVGAVVLVRAAPGHAAKAIVIAALVAAAGHLGWQAWRASFVAYEDRHNPYVYAHTTNDVYPLVETIRRIAAVDPAAGAMHVQVICPDDDYWPLPWYLRDFTRVAWSGEVPRTPPAPMIVTQPPLEPAIAKWTMIDQKPGERYLYVPVAPDGQDADWMLRPFVPLRIYLRYDLWTEYQRRRSEESPPQSP